MVHCVGPTPYVQSVGATVVEGGFVALHICQYAVVDEAPVTLATNCADVFMSSVTDVLEAPETVVVTVTATTVEFELQLAVKTAKSKSAPIPHALICLPPTIASELSLRSGQRIIRANGLMLGRASSKCTAHGKTQSARRFKQARRNGL